MKFDWSDPVMRRITIYGFIIGWCSIAVIREFHNLP